MTMWLLMLELLDEIGREEIKVLRAIERNARKRPSPSGDAPCAVVRCHDWPEDSRQSFGDDDDAVECATHTLSRIEALGLLQSVKGQGYEESRGPVFHMEITTRCRDLLTRKMLVWLASRFQARTNKWIAGVAGGLGVGLGSIDMLYKTVWFVVELFR